MLSAKDAAVASQEPVLMAVTATAVDMNETPVLAAVETVESGRQLQSSSGAPPPNSAAYDSTKTGECCADANPLVDQQIALVVLILNILMPGVGSMVAGYMDPNGCNCKACTFGVLQGILAAVLAGWIWSILQGVAIYQKSNDYYTTGPGKRSGNQQPASN